MQLVVKEAHLTCNLDFKLKLKLKSSNYISFSMEDNCQHSVMVERWHLIALSGLVGGDKEHFPVSGVQEFNQNSQLNSLITPT